MSERIVCWFSHGVASAVATKLAIEENKGEKELVVATIFIEDEHPDNERFRRECEAWFGQEIIELRNERYKASVDEVIAKTRYMSGPSGARCTKELKKQVRLDWQRHDDVHVFGMTVEEAHRIDRLHDNENDIRTWAPLIEKGLTKKECFPILAEAGIEIPMMYRLGFANNNCFSGDTKFITRDGITSLKEQQGKTVSVLNRTGWQEAEIKSFGRQRIVELKVVNGRRKKTIRTTADHRWYKPRHNHVSFGVEEVFTKDLSAGDFLLNNYVVPDIKPSVEGIQNGLVFGDGTVARSNKQKDHAVIRLCGEKIALASYFCKYSKPTNNGTINGLPVHLKEFNSVSDPLGFLIGLVASDGCVGKSGITISNKSPEVCQKVVELCQQLGLIAWRSADIERDTNFKKGAKLSGVVIPKDSFKAEWLLRDFHKNNYGDKRTRAKNWKVVSVTETDTFEEVFCAVVKGSPEFTLEGNLLTGNCAGCLKATGAGYWNRIREVMPEVYAKRANQEKLLGVSLVKLAKRKFLKHHPEVYEAILKEEEETGRKILKESNGTIRMPLRFLPEGYGSLKSMIVPDCGFFCASEDTVID